MFKIVSPLVRSVARPVMRPASRSMVTIKEALTAEDARKISGYSEIDYTINEDATVLDAVQKFSAYNIGCLVTTDSKGRSLEFNHLIKESFF
jgi:predicted transcriptional regulator